MPELTESAKPEVKQQTESVKSEIEQPKQSEPRKPQGVAEGFFDLAKKEVGKDTQGCFVAAILMFCFTASLLWGFWQVSQIIGAVLKPEIAAAERSTAIKDSLQIFTTIGTLFSPLLAFVLGYYFNQSQAARNSADKTQE